MVTMLANACKKIDEKGINTASDDREKITQFIKEKYGNISRAEVYPVNKEADVFYLNRAGDTVQVVKDPNGIYTETCGLDCTTAGDISDLDVTMTLVAINRIFDCGNTANSQLVAHWRISVPYSFAFANPNPPYQSANAAFRIRNSSNVIQYTSANITMTSSNMEPLGPDPECSGNYLYYFTYAQSGVSDSYFANGYNVQTRMVLYNDCDLSYNITLTNWVQGAVFSGSTATAGYPCARIDKVWITSSSTTGTIAQALGSYFGCPSFSPGFVATTKNQIEYRARTHSSSYQWDDQSSIPQYPDVNGSASSTGEISPYGTDIAQFTKIYYGSPDEFLPGYGWLIRYRNVYSGCSNTRAWVTGDYITEFWLY